MKPFYRVLSYTILMIQSLIILLLLHRQPESAACYRLQSKHKVAGNKRSLPRNNKEQGTFSLREPPVQAGKAFPVQLYASFAVTSKSILCSAPLRMPCTY